ncbi:MarR family winged helix-turn-helix transcriptional regulator [Arthrobacter sp. 35W]|uniref:MarR family winged helix-turn-helix transcriptional regulator n=1 Tax=Arthrobacter sp. 35W TaxID=1132441 RepID=UPI000429EA00|nr:MarR family transcriptional regulator [Arthrobacter sp. 35W]
MSDIELDEELIDLAARYRDVLRHAVYLIRSLDANGELSTGQVATMNILALAPARVGDVARHAGIRVPSATEQVIKLEAAGLVERRADPDDARAVLVHLTDAGRTALATANRERNERIAGALAVLSEDERSAITAAIPAIAKLTNSLGA